MTGKGCTTRRSERKKIFIRKFWVFKVKMSNLISTGVLQGGKMATLDKNKNAS